MLRTTFRFPKKRMIFGLAGLVLVLASVLFGVGWVFASQFEDGALRVKHEPHKYEVEVVALDTGRITLRSLVGADLGKEPGTIAIEWPGGYGRIVELAESGAKEVAGNYVNVEGTLALGEHVRVDQFAFFGDPSRAHGIDFSEITFASPLGPLDAWHVNGADDTWVIFVHGHRSRQGESLRMLPVVTGAGLPSLVIAYRNDAGAPVDPTGYHQFGLTEWEDLHAAAQYALDNGASDLVLVGHSMGGGIVASFLYESPLAARVAGAILDAPMLDLGPAIDLAARRRRLPGFVGNLAQWIAGWRFGVDWDAMDYLKRADELSAPILLFHGDADETIPVSVSDRLAAARPDLVKYVRVAGAPHVGSWNADPETYEREVRDFLLRVVK